MDQFAEKMMANSDGGKDPSTCYRDAFDLGVLTLRNGGDIPDAAWMKAQSAYGSDVRRDALWVVDHLMKRPKELENAADTLRMQRALAREAVDALSLAAERGGPPPPGTKTTIAPVAASVKTSRQTDPAPRPKLASTPESKARWDRRRDSVER